MGTNEPWLKYYLRGEIKILTKTKTQNKKISFDTVKITTHLTLFILNAIEFLEIHFV